MQSVLITDKILGRNQPVFVVAELSANHNHSFETAVETIKAAKKAGADAIKLQTYRADTITLDCDNTYFKIKQGTLWDDRTLFDLYNEAYMPWDWQPKLKIIAEKEGLIFFSSPFDKTAVDFLEDINVPAYKIASFEIVDIPLIEYVASKGKPVIISTGIATENEIQEALDACNKFGNTQIALLKCTSEYPAPIERANLNIIPYLKEKFEVTVGLSDHTLGIVVPIAAVALGARIIEKHFILDKNIGGPDSSFSIEPHEFKQMVDAIRDVEKALGIGKIELNENILKSRTFARSLFVVNDIKAGEKFTVENIRSIRPSAGLAPKHYNEILGKKSNRYLKKGTPLSWEYIEQ
jgi:pseudaminic acid synthase